MIDDKHVIAVQRYAGPDSPAWNALEKYMTTMIQDRRELMDDPKMDSIQTAILRGEIKVLKELLALPSQVTQVVQGDPGYGTMQQDTHWES